MDFDQYRYNAQSNEEEKSIQNKLKYSKMDARRRRNPGVNTSTPFSMGVNDTDSPARNNIIRRTQNNSSEGVSTITNGKRSSSKKQVNKLTDSQKQKKQNRSDWINVDDDSDMDNSSTQNHNFGEDEHYGIATDRVYDPKQQECVDQLKNQSGEDDGDYNNIVKRSKNHRQNNNMKSSAESFPNNIISQRIPLKNSRGRVDYGRARLERGGFTFTQPSDEDLLSVERSNQSTDRGSTLHDMVVPRLKKNGNGRKKVRYGMGRSVSQGENATAKREEHSAARDSSSIGVDDDEDIMRALVASNQRYEDKPKKVVALPPLGIGRTTYGRIGKGKCKSDEY